MQIQKQQGRVALIIALILCIGIIAAAMGFYFNKSRAKPAVPENMEVATVLPQARTIIPFSLTDNTGKKFTNADLKGHWTFVFFGFTNCGYICPTTMSAISKVYNRLQEENFPQPNYLLISIDPKRDTVKQLNTFVTAFNKNFKGAVGTEADTEALTKAFNVVYLKTQPKTDPRADQYDIDHSGAVMLINPQGNLLAFFSMPHDPNKIAHDLMAIEKFYG